MVPSRVSITVQVLSVVFSSIRKNRLTSQKPESLTCESTVAPPAMAMTMSARSTEESPSVASTTGAMSPAVGLRTPFDWQLAAGEGRPAPAAPTPDAPPDRPLALDCDAAGLTIRWGDGRVQTIDPRDLRLSCCCAACRDEMNGKRLLDPEAVPLDVVPTRIWSVGNYALGAAFSDGHRSGIYTFGVLRKIEGVEAEDV